MLLLFPVAILAQDKYHVVDAETGEALDGVCMYVTEGKGAWTNENGDAELKIKDNEQVKISYIGYKTLVLKKSELEATIRLTPLSKDLREVSVESDELLLERLAKKLNKEANANRKHRVPFFSRITLQTNDGNEMIESFLEAGSAGIIHLLKLYNGLYYSISASGRSASNLRRTNLHNIFCLGPNTENDLFWKGYVGPLHQGATAAWLKRNYQLSSEVYTNEEGEGLRCITVTPKNNTALIGGKIYLKPSSCDLVYFEGKITADAVVYAGESSTVSKRIINFFINYTNRDGFTEVDNMTFVLTANGIKCRSVMINMEKHNVLEELTWPVEIGRNLVYSLDDTGYNHSMDKYLSIMAHTDVEDALVNGNFSAMTEKEDGQQTTGDGQPTAKWKNALPQEKVYLHLDNTGYFKGETIWFKTYVVRTDTERRGNLSSVLYVDLVSPTGDVMAHKKIYVTHGIGAGSITLDNAVMPTGFYELRAYTRYMTNWSKNACFSRIIPIFREPRKEGDFQPRMDTETRLTAIETVKEEKRAFYPEGGNLVKGLPARVAYTIKGERGVVEIPASSDHKSVEIDINGTSHSYTLPQAQDEGISLRVDALRDDSLTMDLWATSGLSGKELGYALIHSGKVLTSFTFKAQGHQHFSIARSVLPEGISQVTVFDTEGGALADRFVFRCPEYADSLQIQTTTTKLLPCGKVSMDITSTPYTSLSFSAMDASSVVNGKRGDIKTWMLLGSDIRGYIANPEYYLESDDTEHRKAADLLMMIQGWRRYDWDAMNGNKEQKSLQPYESKLAIDGTIKAKKGTNADVAGVTVSATLRGSEENIGLSAVTDSTGRYVIVLPDIQGEWPMSISAAKDGLSDKYIIPINRHFSPASRLPEEFEVGQIPLDNLQIHHWDIPDDDETVWKKFLDARGTTMREVTVKKRRLDNFNYSGFADEKNAQINSTIYYDCEKAVEDYLDRGEEPPYLTEWLAGKKKNFNGNTPVEKAMWAAIGGDSMQFNRDDRQMFVPGAVIDVAELRGMDTPYDTYEDNAPSYWIPVWRDGFSIDGHPVVWMVNNLFCTITNLSLRTDTSSKVPVTAPTIERLTKPNIELPQLLEDVKSLYVARDNSLVHKVTSSSAIEGRTPYLVYCFTKPGIKSKVKGIRYTSYQGFDPVEVFQTEDYEQMPPMNDFRRTLYWNPNLWTDENGKAHVEFWNNSTCTDMIISAEGITDDGKFVTGR
ncbi:MAG: hypothetical protein J6W97_04265 [Bacteroidaceae bacterium]|nr:hypothetical protein [Bacteroidaceae bacterium]